MVYSEVGVWGLFNKNWRIEWFKGRIKSFFCGYYAGRFGRLNFHEIWNYFWMIWWWGQIYKIGRIIWIKSKIEIWRLKYRLTWQSMTEQQPIFFCFVAVLEKNLKNNWIFGFWLEWGGGNGNVSCGLANPKQMEENWKLWGLCRTWKRQFWWHFEDVGSVQDMPLLSIGLCCEWYSFYYLFAYFY